MTHLSLSQCRQELRDSEPISIVNRAIDDLRDWNDRWGDFNASRDPEEAILLKRILGGLIATQAEAIQQITRLAEQRFIRLTEEERQEAEANPVHPPHTRSFANDEARWNTQNENRSCRWCGFKQTKRRWTEVVTREAWGATQ